MQLPLGGLLSLQLSKCSKRRPGSSQFLLLLEVEASNKYGGSNKTQVYRSLSSSGWIWRPRLTMQPASMMLVREYPAGVESAGTFWPVCLSVYTCGGWGVGDRFLTSLQRASLTVFPTWASEGSGDSEPCRASPESPSRLQNSPAVETSRRHASSGFSFL